MMISFTKKTKTKKKPIIRCEDNRISNCSFRLRTDEHIYIPEFGSSVTSVEYVDAAEYRMEMFFFLNIAVS